MQRWFLWLIYSRVVHINVAQVAYSPLGSWDGLRSDSSLRLWKALYKNGLLLLLLQFKFWALIFIMIFFCPLFVFRKGMFSLMANCFQWMKARREPPKWVDFKVWLLLKNHSHFETTIYDQKYLFAPFRNDRIWHWIQIQLSCFDKCAGFGRTRSGLQTRQRSLNEPNPKPKPWFRKGPL